MGLFILGWLVFTSETTWAYINGILRKIEEHFGKNNNEFEKYKFEGDLVSKYDGLKFSIGELMLDDRQLIISMSEEYLKFKCFFRSSSGVSNCHYWWFCICRSSLLLWNRKSKRRK